MDKPSKLHATTEIKIHNSTKIVRIDHSTDWQENCRVFYIDDSSGWKGVGEIPGWLGLNLYLGLKVGNKLRGDEVAIDEAAEFIRGLLANKEI